MIHVDKVTKYYGNHAAVKQLDFQIAEGECVGFLGLNGAGKTTTLRLLSCLLLPTSGRIQIRGIDAEANPHEIRKFVGFLPDSPPLYQEMPVTGFLRFAGKARQMDASRLAKRLPEVLDICGLKEVANADIGTLSHGYQQRVGIAQAIVHEPALLVLDEPIQGLDPVQIVEMREMIRRLRGAHTILLSTHILSEIQQTCDRILMLHEGHIAAQGSEEELAGLFTGGAMVELEVRGDAGALQDTLAQVEGIEEREILDTPEGTNRLRIRAARDLREDLSRTLIQGGFGLLSLSQKATGLERIFVNLSRGSQADGGAAARAAQPTAPAATPAAVKPEAGSAPPASEPSPAATASDEASTQDTAEPKA